MRFLNATSSVLEDQRDDVILQARSEVQEAFRTNANLLAAGYCSSREKGGYDFNTGKGEQHDYMTYGAGCSEGSGHTLLKSAVVSEDWWMLKDGPGEYKIPTVRVVG